MFREDGVNGAAQVADAFAVDDANLEDAPFETRCQVIRDQVFHFGRSEGVQVQHAIDWQFDRLVHIERITRQRRGGKCSRIGEQRV